MATTHLGLWGTPGRLAFKTGFTRNAVQVKVTQLRVPGLPGGVNALSPRAPATTVPIVTVDSYAVSWVEDPFDTNQIITQDAYRVAISEVSQLFNAVATVDTFAVSISETIGLVQQGVIPVVTTDTWNIAWSEVSGVNVYLATTDTWNVAITEVSSLSTPTLAVTTTDAWNITWSEQSVIGIFTGILQIPVSDTYALSWAEASDLQEFSPTKPARIRIQPMTARIRITPI